MSFDLNLIPPLMSAITGLAGVWLGGRIVNQREEKREEARLKAETSYAVIMVIAHLDRLITRCVELAFDDGTTEGRPAGADYTTYEPTVQSPDFDPLALDVDWKSLPPDLLYPILNLPYQIEVLDNEVHDVWQNDDPPEHAEMFWTRQIGYAGLGLEISILAKRLRRHATLPAPESVSGSWDREMRLREKRTELERERAEAYARRVPVSPITSDSKTS
jgi:hypothetical protein